jgi:hypothetical protein
MFIIYGARTARIKNYVDNSHCCKICGVFDLTIKVYRKYYHVFFIPVIPIEEKTSTIRCNNCGEPLRSDKIQRHYENISKTPIYLYTMPILFALPFVIGIMANINSRRENKEFIEKPQLGDVYTIRKSENDSIKYYFLRITDIHGDTIVANQNSIKYSNFVSKLDSSDYFIRNEKLIFTKRDLKQMLDKEEINSVDRNYGDVEGFNRVK